MPSMHKRMMTRIKKNLASYLTRAPRHTAQHGFGLEPLENRVLFAAVTWDGGAATNNWADANNWDNNQVPGVSDDVQINPQALAEIVINTDVGAINSLKAFESIQIDTGGSLNVNNTNSFGLGALFTEELHLNGGTLSAPTVGVQVSNDTEDILVDLDSGTISGTLTIEGKGTSDATLDIDAGFTNTLDLVLQGSRHTLIGGLASGQSLALVGDNDVTGLGGAKLTSNTGFTNDGTIIFTSIDSTDQTDFGTTIDLAPGTTLVNNGIITVSHTPDAGGAGSHFRRLNGNITNNGTITIAASAQFNVGGSVTTGPDLQHSLTFTQAAGTIDADGDLLIDGAADDNPGPGLGLFTFSGGSIDTVGGGTVTARNIQLDLSTTTAAATTIHSGGLNTTLLSNADSDVTLELTSGTTEGGAVLTLADGATNAGRIRMTASDDTSFTILRVEDGDTFTNLAGGVIEVDDDKHTGSARNIDGQGTFVNQGTVEVETNTRLTILSNPTGSTQLTYQGDGGTVTGPAGLVDTTINLTADTVAATSLSIFGSSNVLISDVPSNMDLIVQGTEIFNAGNSSDFAFGHAVLTLQEAVMDVADTFTVNGSITLTSGDLDTGNNPDDGVGGANLDIDINTLVNTSSTINVLAGEGATREIRGTGTLQNQGLIDVETGAELIITTTAAALTQLTYQGDGGTVTGDAGLVNTTINLTADSAVATDLTLFGPSNVLVSDVPTNMNLIVQGTELFDEMNSSDLAFGHAVLTLQEAVMGVADTFTINGSITLTANDLDASNNPDDGVGSANIDIGINTLVNTSSTINVVTDEGGSREIRGTGTLVNQGTIDVDSDSLLQIIGINTGTTESPVWVPITYHADGGTITGPGFLLRSEIDILSDAPSGTALIPVAGSDNTLLSNTIPTNTTISIRGSQIDSSGMALDALSHGVLRLNQSTTTNNGRIELISSDIDASTVPAEGLGAASLLTMDDNTNATLVNSATGTLFVDSGELAATIDVELENAGNVDIQSDAGLGNFDNDGGVILPPLDHTNSGTFSVSDDADVTIRGNTFTNQGSGLLQGAGHLNIQLTSDVLDSFGTIAPGTSPGALSTQVGNINFQTGSLFDVEIGANEVAQIIEVTDSGFNVDSGSWSSATGIRFKDGGNGSGKVSWTFDSLTPGLYQVATTWSEHANRAVDAPYTVLDGVGDTSPVVVDIDQELPPNDFDDGGTAWAVLANNFEVTGSTLVVELTDDVDPMLDDGDGSFVIAGSVRLIPIANDLLVTSGTVDLNGDLQVTLTDGFMPDPADTFVILQAGNLPVAEVFANVGDGGSLLVNGGSFTVNYNTDDDQIELTGFAAGNPPTVIDVTDSAPDFEVLRGIWSSSGDILFKNVGDGTSKVRWTFSGLIPGQYEVSTTWVEHANRAVDATYSIFDGLGDQMMTQAVVDQEVAPTGFNENGTEWQILNPTFQVTGDTLILELDDGVDPMLDDGDGSYVIAGSVRIVLVTATTPLADTTIVAVSDPGFNRDSGLWNSVPDTFLGDIRYKFGTPAGTDSLLSWTFGGLATGTYTVATTWAAHANRATDAPYTIFDGTGDHGPSAVDVNQEITPDDFNDQGFTWETLITNFEVTGDTLIVKLGDAADQFVIGGPVWIQRTGDITPPPGETPIFLEVSDTGFDIVAGSWNSASTGVGPIRFNSAGTGADQVTWTFSGLTAGEYRISTTWNTQSSSFANDAPYTLSDGAGDPSPLTVDINQEVVPNDFNDDGITWEDLAASFDVTGTELVVTLTDDSEGLVIAGTVRIQRLGDL